jgi:hypothetical protein
MYCMCWNQDVESLSLCENVIEDHSRRHEVDAGTAFEAEMMLTTR